MSLAAVLARQEELARHPVFARLTDLNAVRRFMELHVFAVWDFMSLVKALQRELTCVELPWRPSRYPTELVRLINEIVLGEESDLDADGHATSHFDLYRRAMREVGADTSAIDAFIVNLDPKHIPQGARHFVEFTLATVRDRTPVEVAASFFYGREQVIPGMFETATRTLRREAVPCRTFLWYLDRHIEIDSGEHGPLAARCLASLCGGDPAREAQAYSFALEALAQRKALWDAVLARL